MSSTTPPARRASIAGWPRRWGRRAPSSCRSSRTRRCLAVLVLATTRERRVFTGEELALLQALSAETALAFDRARSASALAEALERERLVASIGRKVRSELDLEAVLRVAVEETGKAVGVKRCFLRLGEPGGPMPIRAEWDAEGFVPIGADDDRGGGHRVPLGLGHVGGQKGLLSGPVEVDGVPACTGCERRSRRNRAATRPSSRSSPAAARASWRRRSPARSPPPRPARPPRAPREPRPRSSEAPAGRPSAPEPASRPTGRPAGPRGRPPRRLRPPPRRRARRRGRRCRRGR